MIVRPLSISVMIYMFLFGSYTHAPADNNVIIPNGSKVKITFVGKFFTDKIVLQKVLYVLEYKFKLVSIPMLCVSIGYYVVFYGDNCILLTPSMRPHLHGSLKEGLYCVDSHISLINKQQSSLSYDPVGLAVDSTVHIALPVLDKLTNKATAKASCGTSEWVTYLSHNSSIFLLWKAIVVALATRSVKYIH